MTAATAAFCLLHMMDSIKWAQSQQTHTTPNNSISRVDGITRIVVNEKYELGDRVSCPVCHGTAYVTGTTVHSTGDYFFSITCLDCHQDAVAHKYP